MAAGPRTSFTLILLAACAAVALCRLLATPQARPDIELTARRLVRVSGGQMLLVLVEKDGPRRLAVPVTAPEAALIEGALAGARSLGAATVQALGGRVVRATIDDALSLREFRGHLVVAGGAREVSLEASAGEALSFALQAGAPIVADPALLDAAGVSLDELRGRHARSTAGADGPVPALGI